MTKSKFPLLKGFRYALYWSLILQLLCCSDSSRILIGAFIAFEEKLFGNMLICSRSSICSCVSSIGVTVEFTLLSSMSDFPVLLIVWFNLLANMNCLLIGIILFETGCTEELSGQSSGGVSRFSTILSLSLTAG